MTQGREKKKNMANARCAKDAAEDSKLGAHFAVASGVTERQAITVRETFSGPATGLSLRQECQCQFLNAKAEARAEKGTAWMTKPTAKRHTNAVERVGVVPHQAAGRGGSAAGKLGRPERRRLPYSSFFCGCFIPVLHVLSQYGRKPDVGGAASCEARFFPYASAIVCLYLCSFSPLVPHYSCAALQAVGGRAECRAYTTLLAVRGRGGSQSKRIT